MDEKFMKRYSHIIDLLTDEAKQIIRNAGGDPNEPDTMQHMVNKCLHTADEQVHRVDAMIDSITVEDLIPIEQTYMALRFVADVVEKQLEIFYYG